MQNKIVKWSILLTFLMLITLPYVLAEFFQPNGLVFGGFLQNPLDGNSYLAKMREGFDGEWLFTLPFTSENGEGSYLFTFYLALGHLARISGMSLLLVFHAARICAAILLFFSIEKFLKLFLPVDENLINWMLAISLFGSGMGSIATIITGEMTADFWVAEAYPFLSAYSNPHFPLGISLLLFLFIKSQDDIQPRDYFWIFFCNILLSVILPFAFTIGLAVLGTKELIGYIRARSIKSISPILLCFLGGIPILIYQQWIATHDPLLISWNQQNLTASPALWDILISLSPVLIFAIMGVVQTVKNLERTDIPLIWVLISGLFLIIPLALQRRFILGLFIPLTVLAGRGLDSLIQKRDLLKIVTILLLLFSISTNIIILTAGFNTGNIKNSKVYISEDEKQAFTWLDENSKRDDVVLASPGLGMFLPGWAGVKVVYGHPYETVNAIEKEKRVIEFYKEANQFSDYHKFLIDNRIKYIFRGPREKAISGGSDFNFTGCQVRYSNQTVDIYLCQ